MPLTDNTAQWGVRRLTGFKGDNGIPVGFEYFSTNPNIPAGSLPLFGGEYSRTVYSDLWGWVQEQPNYLLTEEEWQSKASANDGNVPYYSSGDGSTTFRVPSLKCWVKGANGIEEVGSYLSAGLPQIELVNKTTTNVQGGPVASKAGKVQIASSGLGMYAISSAYSGTSPVGFNLQQHPSLTPVEIVPSDEIYGNSDTVQPKSIVGMWLVKAYGTVSNVGSTDVSAIAQGLTEAENRISAIEDNKVDKAGNAWVVETYRNGTEWYRVWSDGWVEQGGVISIGTQVNKTFNFLKPFADTSYHISINMEYNSSASDVFFHTNAYNKTTTGFDVVVSNACNKTWYACGMEA